MFAAIIFSLATVTSGPHSQCDIPFIRKTLRQVEIADYEAFASPPPPSVAGDLYAAIARSVAQCADAPVHFMNSRIGDLLQAATFARFSALEYFDAERTAQACAILREGISESTLAKSLSSGADVADKQSLKVFQKTDASLHDLLTAKCR